VEIDYGSDVFPYQQIAGWLRAGIEAGQWQPGRAIPSLQELVRETGAAVETIRRAVKVLRDEGLVYTVPGRGTFVTRRDD
jgi:DNA-binding GntR family transcriptional regulator